MRFLKFLFSLISILLLFSFKSFSIDNKILFEENKNQWSNQIKYKVGIGNGITLFMEKDRFTFAKYNVSEADKIHEQSHEHNRKSPFKNGTIHAHAFQMIFLHADPDLIIEANNKKDFYHNYFIGNDPSKWAAEVDLYEKVIYKNIYPNINLQAYQQAKNFKYDFIVGQGGNPSLIQIKFNGSDSVFIEHNRLVIKTSVGNIIENIPYTYQLINNVKKEVKCEYKLSSDASTVSFIFPEGYDTKYNLIIDPVIIGATYSGSLNTTDTYGHCATYDFAGNIYTGGECFGIAYPVTLGAYQTIFAGNTDIVISKLNPTGTNLIWATYLGGNAIEIPNSLFVNTTGEIYILGASESFNYPTTTGCFDNSYNGLADIVITHLNTNGSALVGSTYYGGTGDDSQSSLLNSLPWQVNWHDAMRGEIIVDAAGNAYIASFTNSANFPTTTGAYRQVLTGPGTFDAVVFKMNSNLSSNIWSTFVGGTANECAYGLRVNTSGEVYFTGATTSVNFPSTPGAYDITPNGGQSDAYVALLNSTGTSLLRSTFFGTLGAEVGYFLDLDPAGNPCIYGISSGNIMPVTTGVYSNPGGYNFVSGFNTTLSTLRFSTVFGSGSYLEPSAFMVDLCGNLYMSGFNSTPNYPVTIDAITTTPFPPGGADPVWDLNNSYFIVLSKNATNLLYGSFYYGMHVDGGTSRFDPNGSIYQGICIHNGIAAAPPGAYNNGSAAPEWDMFVTKIAFDFPSLKPIAVPVTTPDTACVGSSINFANNSTGAVSYSWDFGDGSPQNPNVTPSHTYAAVGTYTVTLIANGPIKCSISDTTQVTVVILPLPVVNLGNDTAACIAPNMILNAGNNAGCTYLWSTGATTQTININSFGAYWVKVDNGACSVSDTINVTINPNLAITVNSPTICNGQSTILNANGASNYLWNPGALTINSITVSPNSTTTYTVTGTTGGCIGTAIATITVLQNSTSIINQSICVGGNFIFNNQILTTAGSYNDTLTSFLACDSIITLNLFVNPNSSGIINHAICSGNNYFFNNQTLTAPGLYNDTLISFWGCDSVVKLNLTVNPIVNGSFNHTICSGNNYVFNNQILTATGSYNDTLTSFLACDSIVTLNLFVNPNSSGTINQTICLGSNYFFNNQILTNPGSYKDTLTSFLGCDSIVTLNLVINPIINGSFNHTICPGSNYIFNNQVLTISGSYNDTLTSFFGCDSILTLNLVVNPIVNGSFNHTICPESNYIFNNQILTIAGSYNDTLISFLGCDSIVTLNLAISPIVNRNINHSICSGSNYVFNNQILNTAGSYNDTLLSFLGCDSIVTLNLAVNPIVNGSFNYTICSGNNYIFNNQILTTTGSYKDTLISFLGCDSVVTLNLIVIQNVSSTFNQTICSGQNIILTAPISGTSYLWSTGATSSTINISSGGIYWLNISMSTCIIKDTFNISEIPYPQVNLGQDMMLCMTPNITLNAGNIACTYLWSTGAVTQSITVTNFGTYWVKVDNGYCYSSDTIKIIDMSISNFLGNDTTLCIAQNINLTAPPGMSNYLWSIGATTQTINVSSAGNYFVMVSNQYCTTRDTIKVDYVQPIGWVTPANFCNSFTYTLDAGSGAQDYLWSTGATTQSIEVSEQGVYWVTIIEKGCSLSDTMKIDESLGGAVMFLPNTFTPDYNGLNDMFTAKGLNLTYYQMIIFNRWGEEIFQSNNQYHGWDGTYKGEIVVNDVYVCRIKYKTLCSKDELLEKIVHVNVLR